PSTGLTLFAVIAIVLMGVALSRPERKDLDALAAGANALLERLPRPDAAMLVGLALQVEPPKWTASAPAQPKLAIVASPEKPRVSSAPAPDANASRVVSVDALPKFRPVVTDAMLWKGDIGPVADVATPDRATLLAKRETTPLPTVSVTQKPSVSTRAKHLVSVHSVSPRYPDVGRVSEPVRIDLEFAVASDGSVQDVTVLGDDGTAFGAAAKKAMSQWRFDPASAPRDAGVRFQQSFVFAKQSDVRRRAKPAEGEEFDCVRRTGSLVCRHPQEEEVALPLTIIDGNADIPAHP
ncbi:MAG: energy transducer TonB, partial [Rhodanobacteraceae bacterium]